MTSNDAGLRYGDGNASDWIENYKAGDMPVNLAGNYLADEQEDLTRWEWLGMPNRPGYML